MQCLHVIRYRSYYWTALLQLSLTSIPSAPFEPTIYTIEARYDILAPVFPYFLSKPEKKHWDASFWPGAKKTFRLPKTPLGAKNTIPAAFKPIPGTDRPRPWEPETSKKHQEQKTPFQEQKTRNPIFPLYFQKCESASAFKHGMSV